VLKWNGSGILDRQHAIAVTATKSSNLRQDRPAFRKYEAAAFGRKSFPSAGGF
jgi:hypothetical protein